MDVERTVSEDPEKDPDSGPRLSTKACDTCRARKIKCNRKTPCSSCIASNVHCTTSTRQPEKKKRILISAGYEREVRGVNERLANLEKTIHTLVASPNHTTNVSHQPPLTGLAIAPRTLEEGNNIPFEGASSFTAHSKEVSQAFISATTPDGLQGEPASTPSLENGSSVYGREGPAQDLYELPPMPLVLKMLRAAKTNPSKYFPGLSDLNLTSLTDMCQKVYFPAEDCSTALLIVVHIGLWKVFSNFGEQDLYQHGIDELEFERAKALCTRNIDEAARSTPLLLDHSYRQIQALFLLEAGYHCLTFESPDSQVQEKIVIFWIVFSLDRGLSLNFGKGPSLQDYDITASKPSLANEPDHYGIFLCTVGIELGYLQGDVYQQLFSGRAQSENAEVKAQLARVLGERMISLRHKLLSFETNGNIWAVDMIEAYELVLLSHLALIYRAIPSLHGNTPLHFSGECIEASRTVMQKHNVTWAKYQVREDTNWKTVINWGFLFSPFIAFIVLFGTVITHHSSPDLQLMSDSILTLKAASNYSPGIAKLHEACETFFNLAKAYMAQKGEEQQQPVLMETFDLSNFQGQDWDAMLDEWDLGLGGENAREMSSFLTGNLSSWPA